MIVNTVNEIKKTVKAAKSSSVSLYARTRDFTCYLMDLDKDRYTVDNIRARYNDYRNKIKSI